MSHIRSLNRVILVGRVGRNPELTVIPSSGRELAKFSMVTNEGYYDQSRNWRETEEWHNINAWGPLAQRIEKNVGKGDLVLVEGKIKSRKWKDQSGQEKKATDIEAQNLIILERRNQKGASTAPIPRAEKTTEHPETNGDLPSPFEGTSEAVDLSNEEDPF